ncbi:hypothetical protein B7486_00200 [cyanobacterium TDX16]|nr:hypothetical protein B7486_00200 [cyanobacterium TDX16]
MFHPLGSEIRDSIGAIQASKMPLRIFHERGSPRRVNVAARAVPMISGGRMAVIKTAVNASLPNALAHG